MSKTKKPKYSQISLNPKNWVDRYGDYLYSFALFRVQNRSDSEDIVQDTFIAALQNRKSFKGLASEKTWLTTILKNKIIDYLRKQSRETPTDDIERYLSKPDTLFNSKGKWINGPGAWSIIPSKIYAQKEFWKILRKCLKSLPKQMSQAFVLREMDGMNHAEICKVLKISSSNSWVVLYRARMGLKKCLSSSWFGQ